MIVFHEKVLMKINIKTLENDGFCLKIVHLDQFLKKKSPAAGPLSGRLFKQRAASGGPLRGGFNVKLLVNTRKNTKLICNYS